MESSVVDFTLIGISLLLSGFYSGSEAALVSLSVDRTRQLIEAGGKKGKALSFLANRPNEVLTTILVGNNLVNIFVASLATTLAYRYFQEDAVAITVGVTTFFILLFGEIIPKTFARRHAEVLAFPIIIILKFNYYLLYPVIRLFTWIIHTILGENAQLRGRVVTKNDIEFMVNRAEEEQSMDSKHLDLLSSILEFPTIKVKDVMVSRQNIIGIEESSTFNDIIQVIQDSAHSRYPVFTNSLDNILGFLHVKDLASIPEKERENFQTKKHMKDPFFVYEHMKIQAVFDYMNRKKVHLAMVKDEMGTLTGIVTLEDILEEIFGEISDEHDDDLEAEKNEKVRQVKGGLIAKGDYLLRDLDSDFEIELPLDKDYSTITGFILDKLGNSFPRQGSIIVWEHYSFELIKVEGNEIKEILIRDLNGKTHSFQSPHQLKPNVSNE